MALKPLADRIVIKVIEDTEQTSGGIFIPDSAKEKPQKGEVVAVGEGKTNEKGEKEPLEVKVGDIVLYAGWKAKKQKEQAQPQAMSYTDYILHNLSFNIALDW